MSAAPARAPARRTHPPKGTCTPAATCSSTRGPPSSCSTPIDLPFLAVEQQQHQLLLLEQLHAEKSGRRRRGRARRREQVSRRQRARTSRSRGSARPAICRASEQRAAARDSNSVTRKTYHVPKPATFHTHTDHTLLLTPTDYNKYHHIVRTRYSHTLDGSGRLPDGFGRLSGFGRPFSFGWPTSLSNSATALRANTSHKKLIHSKNTARQSTPQLTPSATKQPQVRTV